MDEKCEVCEDNFALGSVSFIFGSYYDSRLCFKSYVKGHKNYHRDVWLYVRWFAYQFADRAVVRTVGFVGPHRKRLRNCVKEHEFRA